MKESLDPINAVDENGNVVPHDDVFPQEECAPLPKEQPIFVDYEPYWQTCIDICNACGRYQAAKKLLNNYNHEETHHSVRHIVDNPKYYGGSPGKVKVSRETRREAIIDAVEIHNALCRRLRLEELDPDVVIAELSDGAIIDRWRKCFKTCLKNNYEPFAFADLPERRFRRKR